MIILGYPCIGKTTLAQRDAKFIDLESSNFSINGTKPEGWHEIYCKVAIDLYKQGKIVFISQHKEVQDYMSKWLENNPDELVIMVFPAPWLKQEWCNRAKKRYDESQDEKDLRAYERIEKCFDLDIKDLEHSNIPKMVISSESASLSDMINNTIKLMNIRK